MIQLTWADLLVEDLPPESAQWLRWWGRSVGGPLAPVFMNKFGFWFLRRPEGHVEVLDVFSGNVEKVADTWDEFQRCVNERPWQEVFLLSRTVYALHEAGKVAGPAQCYALAPHPALGGPNPLRGDAIDPQQVMVVDLMVWQCICVQSLWRDAVLD